MIKWLVITSLVAFSVTACGGSSPADRYDLKGKVVNVDKRGRALTIAHEEIPGYMEAMTMPFSLKDEWAFDELAAGDRVQATLVVAGDRSWIEGIIITREAPDQPGSASGPGASEPEAGDEVPDFALVNQHGRRIRLGQYRGRALLLTFIYTRCPLPDYCPLMTERFTEIDGALKQEPALYEKTHLLSISVDPQHDTPDVLRSYAEANGLKSFEHWELASGSDDEVKRAARFFGLQYWAENDQIIHSLRTALIGPDGKLVKLFRGNEWKSEEIIDQVRGLGFN